MRFRPAIAAFLALPALVAACSSSGSSSDSSGPSANSPSGVRPTGTGLGSELTTAQAKAALLTPSQVGSGMKSTPPAATVVTTPCTPGAAAIDTQVPPDTSAKAAYTDAGADLQLSEEVNSYPDDATAVKALAAIEKGYACDTTTIGAQRVTIQGPIDLTTSFTTRLDGAELWAVNGAQVQQSVIVAKMGQRVVLLVFGQLSSANTAGFDAKGIADRAIGKVGAAGQ